MEAFKELLISYSKLPYRPENLVEKVRIIAKNCNFSLVRETKDIIKNINFEKYYKPIFGTKNICKFTKDVNDPKSIENFQNMVYEMCKLNENKMNKEEILLYLFIFDIFKKRITNSIYNAMMYYDKRYSIYENILYNFLNFGYYLIDKSKFDTKYLKNWIDEKLKNEENSFEKDKNVNQFSKQNIKLNFLKYDYYGPEIKYNYILNEENNIDEMKVALFSPDFLIEKNLITEYGIENFQIFNENNSCPDLFKDMLKDAIKELNKKFLPGKSNNNIDNISNDDIDNISNDDIDNIISDVGIMKFKDETLGVYLNVINASHYFEIKDLIKNISNYENKEIVQVIANSSISMETRTKDQEDDDDKYGQNFYSHYNSCVSEEQLIYAIINSINEDIITQGIERLPRVIFYFNLYIMKSLNEKKGIVFVKNENRYGFDEADGVFYLGSVSNDIILNKTNIPFVKIMTFKLKNQVNNDSISYNYDIKDSKITLTKNSFIYVETKYSCPIKYDKNSNSQLSITNSNEVKKLIIKILLKCAKFYEIAEMKQKEIKNIHILLFYDNKLQSNEEINLSLQEFKNIFDNIKIKIKKVTIFDIIFFANPSSLNMKKFQKKI